MRRTLILAAGILAATGLAAAGPGRASASVAALTVGCSSQTTAPSTAKAVTLTASSTNRDPTATLKSGYILQLNEFNSTQAFAATTDGSADFKISKSSLTTATDTAIPYAPGAYPSLYMGNHFGTCSPAAEDLLPFNVGVMLNPIDIFSMSTSLSEYAPSPPVSTDNWDSEYDIWYSPSVGNDQAEYTGLEMMIWVNHYGTAQPAGSEIMNGTTPLVASLDGSNYYVWYDPAAANSNERITFERTTETTGTISAGVSLIDFTNYLMSLTTSSGASLTGVTSDWYLYDVEAGFEVWQGGQWPCFR